MPDEQQAEVKEEIKQKVSQQSRKNTPPTISSPSATNYVLKYRVCD